MKRPFGIATSLRTTILITVGATIILITMLMSWGILYSWRKTLITQEESHALAVSRAFSVAVIDALIYADQDLYQTEGFLDNYVTLFVAQNRRLRSITILDDLGNIVARSWDRQQPPWISGDLPTLTAAPAPMTTIAKVEDSGWVIETVLPMQTGNRRWGTLVLGIEADSIRAALRRGFLLLASLTAAVTSIMLLLLWWMLGRLLGSLRSLVDAMDTVALDGRPVPALPSRDDEIGVLYHHFDNMQRRLEQSQHELLGAQQQIWHAERLAAIGRLAAGIAHEINNPINGIRNCVYAIRNDLEDTAQTREYLDLMDEGLAHTSSIIQKLLGYARKQQPGFTTMNLNDAVETVTRLVAFAVERKRIRMERHLAPQLPSIQADPQLIREVCMNLLLNAIDAVDDGGEIELSTRIAPADRVVLEVRDQGKGIAAEKLGQIFDPFYTTKRTGEGTGLGLAISLGIISAHGGTIDVASDPQRGTTFTISLPIKVPAEILEATR